MIKSMTAFGRAKISGEHKDVTVEIKSVNSRFFDCSVKIPRAYTFLEERIKNYVRQNAVDRAKVDVYLTIDSKENTAVSVKLDAAMAKSYIAALYELRDTFFLTDDISVMRVAARSDLFSFEKAEEDLEGDWELIREALDLAIAGYSEMREREGERIFSDICAKLEHIKHLAEKIEEISARDTVGYREKLEARLKAILADNSIVIDENRVLTECAIWADKIAIDEELVRLRSHFKAFFEISASKEPSGRKLDFLMQELNRETNTIGSKANNSEIAHIVVEIKGELEKIREQVQNIE